LKPALLDLALGQFARLAQILLAQNVSDSDISRAKDAKVAK